MTQLSLSDSNLISGMLKNPEEDLQKVLGIIEEKIDQSEKRSHRIYDNSIEGICIVDPMADMTFVNQCMAEIFGYSKEEMIGNSIYSLMSEKGAKTIKKHLKKRKKGISERYKANLKHKNGKDILVQIKAAPLYDEDGNFDGSVAFLEDITEKMKTEQQLRESEEKFRTIAEQSLAAIGIFQNNKILYLNKAYEDFTGISLPEIYSMTVNELIDAVMIPGEKKRVKIHAKITQSGERKIPDITESQVITKNGNKKWVLAYTKSISFQGRPAAMHMIIDITERRQMELKLKESEQSYRTVIQDQTELIVRWRINGILTFVNDSYCDYFQKDREELIGSSFLPLIPDEDHEVIKRNFSLITVKNPIMSHEHRVFKPDGTVAWINWMNRAIIDENSKIIEYQSVGRDITGKRRAEQKLIESEEKYRSLFEDSPVGLMDQDFSELKKYIDQLKVSGINDFSKFFDDQPEELLKIMALPKIIDVNRRAIELYGARNKEDFLLKMNQLSENIEKSMTEELFLYNKMEILSLINGGTMYDSGIETKSFKEEYLCLYAKTSIVSGFESTWSNVIVTMVDITERKKMEENLRREYELNKNLIQASPAYYAAINTEGKIMLVNDMMLDVLGYTLEEVLNEDYLTKFVPEREHKLLWKTFRNLMNTTKPVQIKNHILTKSGQELLVEWHGRAVFKTNSEFDYLFGFGIDISERAIFEDKLKKSEKKYRNFLENFQGIAFQGKLDFTPIFFHGKVEEITGYKEKDFVSNNPRWDQIILDEDRKLLKGSFKRIHDIPNTVIEREYRIITKNGKKKWVHEIISNVRDEDGKPYMVQGIINEITNRKEIEQALEDSEAKYRTLYETSKDGLALVDTKGNIIECNPAYCDLLKCSKEKLLKLNYHQFTPNKWRNLDDLMDIQAIDKGFTEEFEKEYINSKGETIPVNVRLWESKDYSGKTNGIWGLVRDISERQKTADALKASEEKYRNLVETSSMGLIEISFVTKELIYFNPKLMEIIGYTYEELMKENAFHKFIHPEDLKEMDFSITDRKLEFRVITKDGKIKWLSGDRLYYYDKKGTLAYARLWLQDITEKKSLEEIKANLLIRFSHEFKTPLISIKGFSEFLLEEYRDKLSEKIISFLEKIHQGADKLQFLTNNFLETSQLDENIVRVKIREVNFVNLISKVLAGLEGIIKSRNHTINLKIDKDLLIECDSEKISTVMSNLILNSSKFTPPAGIITVSAAKERDSVIITVIDNGIGLSKEEKKKIFLPFGKIERYGQGFDIVPDGIGMGLYISKELVELHKGTIGVESAGRNKGSTFTIKIPRNQ